MPVKGNRSVPKELEGRGTGMGRLPKGFGSKPDGAACCHTHQFPGWLDQETLTTLSGMEMFLKALS